MDELIIKYFQNSCSEEEKKSLFDWLDKSSENKAYYIQMRKLWDMNTLLFSEEKDQELNEAYTSVKNKLKPYPGKPKIRQILWSIGKYAAVGLLCFGLSWYFYHYQKKNESIAWQTLEVPIGQRVKLTLADGTKVWLNSKSRLTFPQNFTKGNRLVKLEGEAYFEVFHNPQSPFRVNTPFASLNVTGTKFNVYAYANEPYHIETTLLEGKVEFAENKTGGQHRAMAPHQQLRYNAQSSELKVTDKVDIQAITSWIYGIHTFQSCSMTEVIQRLEHYYNVSIEVKDSSILSYPCTGKFRLDESLSQVLKVISTVKPFKFKITESKVLIY